MHEPEIATSPAVSAVNVDRRTFLGSLSTMTMATALIASYGTFAAYAGRFLLPARGRKTGWLIVGSVASIEVGEARPFRAPDGSTITVARQGARATADDFVALSSTCPHLGCQVRYEAQNRRYFCPCHNGTFDPSGRAIAGPPFDAGQSLPRYPLKVESGLLYIEVPLEKLA